MSHIHSSRMFSYHKEDRTFTTEVSDLGRWPFDFVLSGAYALKGLVMRSAKTGAMASFYIDQEEVDEENDLVCWKLKPTKDALQAYPQLEGVTVVVFND